VRNKSIQDKENNIQEERGRMQQALLLIHMAYDGFARDSCTHTQAKQELQDQRDIEEVTISFSPLPLLLLSPVTCASQARARQRAHEDVLAERKQAARLDSRQR